MSISLEEAELSELWQKFKLGDQKAFTDLMSKVYKLMFNYATKFTKDRELIKDCLQNLFTEIWQKRKDYSEIKYVKIYLITSLRNNLIHTLKKTKRTVIQNGLSNAYQIQSEKNIEWSIVSNEKGNQLEQELKYAISQLSDRQQEVIFLKFYEGLSNEEISQIMGIGRQPVANMVYKAITQLKKTFSYKHLLSILLYF